MPTGLSKVNLTGSTNFNGFLHLINDILKGKCFIYIAKGEFQTSDVPTNKNGLTNLISGSTSPFLPLGDMDATGSNVSWSEKTIETDFSTLGAGYEVTGTFVSITVSKKMLNFIDGLGNARYSFLFVPEGTDDVFFALSGMTVTTEGNLGVVEDGLSKITFKVSRKANKLTDVIKLAKLTSTTNPDNPYDPIDPTTPFVD